MTNPATRDEQDTRRPVIRFQKVGAGEAPIREEKGILRYPLLTALRRNAANHCDDLSIQSGGDVGLRAFEIPQIC